MKNTFFVWQSKITGFPLTISKAMLCSPPQSHSISISPLAPFGYSEYKVSNIDKLDPEVALFSLMVG